MNLMATGDAATRIKAEVRGAQSWEHIMALLRDAVRSQGFNNFVQSVCDEYQALCERMGLREHGRPPYTRGDFIQFTGDLERREEEAEAE